MDPPFLEMALTLEDRMMMSFTMEETMLIHVQNTIGETAQVRVRLSDPTALFPRQVADQVGFNPRMASRLRFWAIRTREDEDAPLSLWRSVQFSGKTWKEVFPGGEGSAMLLHMEIEDDTEEERQDKLRLLRFLIQQHGAEGEEDAVLWGEYLQWFMYSKGGEHHNRYDTMYAFVAQRVGADTMMC